MSNLRWLGLLRPMAVLAFVTFGGLGLFGRLTSHAVQNPTISLDMAPSGNSYDEATNTMTVGASENCLTSATANPATHTHKGYSKRDITYIIPNIYITSMFFYIVYNLN